MQFLAAHESVRLQRKIRSVLISCFLSELHKTYGKEFITPEQPFTGTKCNINFLMEDFLNLMTVQYQKGHFILEARFNNTYNYELYPNKETDAGVCKTIKPMVDFNTNLRTQNEKDEFKIELGGNVLSGEANGLTVLLDVETYDHGYTQAKGKIDIKFNVRFYH